MLKRINWKSVFKCFVWIVCLSGVVVLMSFVERKKHTVTCTKIKILIPGADNFIEREEIDAILKQSQGQLIGRQLEGVNLQEIEKKMKANPYIAMATVYADMDGVIHVEVKQRQPILRVINSGGQDYYIDSDGLKMPVSPNFTANVLAANGNILEHFGGKVDTLITELAVDLYTTASFIKKDTLWDAQIEQLFVNEKKEIELIPRVGNQRIILGSADSLDVKMRNLLAFYKQAMPKVGWDTYKTINIKYTNQVVCEKSKADSTKVKVPARPVVKDTVAANKPVIDALVRQQIEQEIKNDQLDDEGRLKVGAKPRTDPPKPEKKVVKPEQPGVKPKVTSQEKPAAAQKTVVVQKPATASAKEKVKTDTRKNK